MHPGLAMAHANAKKQQETKDRLFPKREDNVARLTKWANIEGNYIGTAETQDSMPPGVYDIHTYQGGIYFAPLDAREDELLRFPDTNTTKVVEEIETFWTQEKAFRKHSLPYKRGILLHGPPGSGKSSTLRLVAADVVERGGVVFTYTGPETFTAGYRVFRMIQRETPVVVLMEDLDTILSNYSETKVLNLLDGVENVDKVVFLATTNYPAKLGERIANRPSRFDRKYLVPHPSQAGRELYLRSLLKRGDKVDVVKWAKDTDGLSLAHLKELFIATSILGNEYAATLAILKAMKETESSEDASFGVYA